VGVVELVLPACCAVRARPRRGQRGAIQ
jgi:hypothetical protein